jgi:glycosyltransferase involved in cell wall biosynthesis
MKFGVAIPVRGQQEFISTALRSLRTQSVPMEIAILDATPDKSIQRIIGKYEDLSVVYVRHGPDDGQAAAIQEGWNRTGGNVLSWLNADDYLLPGSLAVVEQAFALKPEVDVVYGDAVFVDRVGGFIGYFPAISSESSDIVKSCCIAQPACFVRRLAVEKIGGLNTKLNYVMDWDLWTRLFLGGAKFLYIKRPLALVRMHEETKTASGSIVRLREIQRHLRRHRKIARLIVVTIALVADAARSNSPLWQKTLRAVMEFYRRSKVKLLHWLRPSGVKELYGIDIFGNRVRSLAEVWLPWFGESKPMRITVEGEGFQHLRIEVNGMEVSDMIVHDGPNRKKEAKSTIPSNVNQNGLFIIKLSSKTNRPWKLTSVRLI